MKTTVSDRRVCTLREVEGEGRLICSKVVYMEDELLRQVLFVPPNDPPNSCIHESVLVAANIDALHQRQTEIPLEFRV